MNDSFRSGAVDLHQESLVKPAQRFVSENPGKRTVALVAEGDVAEVDIFRRFPRDYRVVGVDRSVSLILDREEAKQYLLRVAARNFEWLADEGSGPVRSLPVIHIAQPGIRSGGLPALRISRST